MARLREGELLKIRLHHLAALLLLAVVPPALAEGPRPPVFFEEPDERTAAEIRSRIDDLERQQIADRTRGREALAAIGYWAVPPLLELLRDGDGHEVRNASLTMGRILDPRGVDPLLRVARHGNHRYSAEFATLMLGRYRDTELLPALEGLIRDKSKSDRRVAAILAVGKTRGPEAFEILTSTIRTAKLSIEVEAATLCLGFFREEALERGPDGRTPIRELLRSLRSSETSIRRAAILALALLGHRDLKPFYLDAAVKESDPDIQRIGLLALGRFPDEDVTELLLRTLEDKTTPGSVQLMAAFLLKDRKDPKALDRLKQIAPRVRDAKIRASLILALSNFEDREVTELLVRALADRKDQVRAAAAIGLSRITSPELAALAITGLTAMLSGRGGTVDPDVIHNMRLARDQLEKGEKTGEFVWLGNEQFAEDLPKDVEEMLLDLVNVEAWQVLGLNDLTDIRVSEIHGERFRVKDQTSELRDLAEHLERHPYFEPMDVPAPRLAVTPGESR